MLDGFAKAYFTRRARELLNKHTRFVRCEKDDGFVIKSVTKISVEYGCQRLYEQTDLRNREELKDSAHFHLRCAKAEV